MSAAGYTNRVRTQSQARVTKVQYPGTVSNNYDPLFSSIDCNPSYNVLDYKGVPCICSPSQQPFLFGFRFGSFARAGALQFSLPVSVVQPLVHQTVPAPNYDINPAPTNPHYQIPNIYVQTPKEIAFGGGSKNPDDYVVYGGGNSQLLL